jgi:hypothetical protein
MDLALGWLVETADSTLQLKRVSVAHLLVSCYKGIGMRDLDNHMPVACLDASRVESVAESSSAEVGDDFLQIFVNRLCGDRIWMDMAGIVDIVVGESTEC